MKLYIPAKNSHKGQNGKLLLIGGSDLFHAASLWALKVASRIVDLVHYSSTEENNQIVKELKKEFRDGIVIKRADVESYIQEDDCILIGPGMERNNETKKITERLLKNYPDKKWVIDAGALQMMELSWIPQDSILTPHAREFRRLFNNQPSEDIVKRMSYEFNCTILVKGVTDIVCTKGECKMVKGGNSGMTKGGTGDVLAGLVASLYCKNIAFSAAYMGSVINKKAGDRLFKKVGYYFNASDLADEIPKVMKSLIT
ncbi:NAD(P)H-hydrate dehydratase [Candidatus Gottesmanbacteria bacterium]|nr:NAD(P)H-hydrate dehydratase [Candidatus Gottesmanbacteria bacterium]